MTFTFFLILQTWKLLPSDTIFFLLLHTSFSPSRLKAVVLN